MIPSPLRLLLTLGLCATALCHAAEINLFDGKTLKGWKNFGGGKFYVEDGAIVGESKPGLPNSFLATDKEYKDFELEVDFMIDPLLNSGIQIRSHVYPAEAKTIRWGGLNAPDGSRITKEMTWEKGRFWGYQIEIDPSERGWTGAIYEEAGRGFLHQPSHTSAYRPGQWNHFRIRANGDHIQAWLNGVAIAEVHDKLTASGMIALQLHGIGKSMEKVGQKVRWRNIRLRKL